MALGIILAFASEFYSEYQQGELKGDPYISQFLWCTKYERYRNLSPGNAVRQVWEDLCLDRPIGLRMPTGRPLLENGFGLAMQPMGRAPEPRVPALPFMGASEITPTVGSPPQMPTALIVRNPPNTFTPSDGSPGGSFNFNAVLASLFKFDVEQVVSLTGPQAANAVILSLSIARPGIWAFEITISGNVSVTISTNQQPSGVPSFEIDRMIYQTAGDSPVVRQHVRLFETATPASPGLLNVSVVEALAAGQTVVGVGRAKQLAGV